LKRIGFNLIGGKSWLGGYNYQLNLLRAIRKYQFDEIEPYLFLGQDIDTELLDGFNSIGGLTIVQSIAFNRKNENKRLIRAIIFGVDRESLEIFTEYNIDAVFCVAGFFGRNFPIKTIAWIPDFQHKHLSHLFNRYDYWKRDIGFRLQIKAATKVMLSSHTAKRDSHRFFPSSISKTEVVSFAVPMQAQKSYEIENIKRLYGLERDYFFLPNQFWKHKNHTCVIEALGHANREGHEIQVVSTGGQHDHRSQSYFQEIMGLIEKYQLEKQFILLGPIPYQHVMALMAGCKALLNPSRFEGWSTTVEEAKAKGVKMILSDIDVHKEQAAGYATFFDVTSPHDLSIKMVKSKEELEATPRVEQDELILKAEFRVKFFAKAFTKLINQT